MVMGGGIRGNSGTELKLYLGCTGSTDNHGHKQSVDLLIRAGADVNLTGNNGDTPLMLAAEKGHDKCIPILLRAGAQINRLNTLADLGGREGRTPPPGRPNSFDFMQFSGKFGVFTPPLEGSRPPLGKILDPPLQYEWSELSPSLREKCRASHGGYHYIIICRW